jgi:hypothetical protein
MALISPCATTRKITEKTFIRVRQMARFES